MTLTASQQAIRKGRISASMVASILGEGQFGSPLTAWLEIMGLPREDISDRPEVRAGNYFEQGVCDWWQDDIGTPAGLVALEGPAPTVVHPVHDWLCATPDRLLHTEFGLASILEAKTGGWYRADEWEDHDTREVTVPLGYVLQVQTQLEVLDLPEAHIAAVIGGNKPFFGVIQRDRAMMSDALKLLQAWYTKHVVGNVQPDPTGEACDTRALRKLHPMDSGEVVQLSSESIECVRKSLELKEQIATLSTERERLRNLLRAEMKAATFGEGPGVRVSHKTNKRGVRTLLEE